jgi:hypothetical protein
MSQLDQDLFYLRYHVIFIRERHLKPYVRMNNISRPAEIHDYRHGAAGESFKHDAGAVVANRGEEEYVSRAHAPEHILMAEIAAEADRLLNSEIFCELLEAFPFGAIAGHGELSLAASQQ